MGRQAKGGQGGAPVVHCSSRKWHVWVWAESGWQAGPAQPWLLAKEVRRRRRRYGSATGVRSLQVGCCLVVWLAGESKLGKRSVVGEQNESGSIVRGLCMDSRNGAAKREGG